ncbi:MAG: Ig-like domain-containing protein [Ferruginibacter sp.]
METNSNGCQATTTTQNITVNPIPVGILSSSSTIICAGDNVTFTAAYGTGNTYNFIVNGVSIPTASTNTYSTTTLTNPSVVSVEVTNASGCVVTSSIVIITVNALPSNSLVVTENSNVQNDNSICAGQPVTYTFNTGFSNYKFLVNNISIQNGSSNIYTNTTLVTGDTVKVEVTNGNNCKAIFTAPVITIVPSPVGSLSASSTIICLGDNVDFTATPGLGNNYEFLLNTNTPLQNGTLNTFSTTGLANGDKVMVIVTNTNTCVTTSNIITMVVNAVPTGVMTIAENSGNLPANDGIICVGASVVFTAPTGFYNYDFLLNGISVQNSTTLRTYTTTTLVNGDKVTVAVKNGSGCIALLNEDTIRVNALPPVAPISGGSAVCVNDTTRFTSGTTGGVWTSANTAIATVNTTGLVTGVNGGTVLIKYTVTNSNGCDSMVSKSVTVNALPAITAITGTANVCVNSTRPLANATSFGVWSSSDPLVATISSTGVVSGLIAGTTIIKYKVTNGNGCADSSTTSFVVNDLPVLDPITFQAPASSFDVCVNANISLANTTPGGVWTSSNTSVATISGTGVLHGVAAGTTTVTYTFTNGNGCTSATTQTVTVNPLPIPTITGKNPICIGDVETYTTQPGQSNYVWNVFGGTITAGTGGLNDNTIEITWTATGSKTLSVNYTNSFGCTAAISSTFTNAPTTTPPTFISGVNTVCLNSTNSIYSTQPGKADYTWTINGGTVFAGGSLTDDFVQIQWNSAGSRSVTINYSDAFGCTAAASAVYPVTVDPLPTASIAGGTSICENATGSTNITFAGVGGIAPYIFTYTLNGGPLQTVNSVGNTATVSVPLNIPSSFDYELVSVANAAGLQCGQPQTGHAIVIVNPSPTAKVTGTTATCQFDPSLPLITLTGATGTGPYTFTYNINGAPNQVTAPSVANVVTLSAPTGVSGNFVYNLVSVMDANGCSQAQVFSATITIDPKPSVVTHNAVVCSPGTIDLTAPSITFGSTAGLTYSYWTDALATNPYGTPTTAGAGNYYIKGTTGAGCYDIQLVTVTVNPTPTLTITNPGAVCSPATVDLTAASITSGSTSGLTFTYWTDLAATNPYGTPLTAGAGNYYIKGSTSLGCFDIKLVTVTVNSTPTVITNNPAAVCAPATVNLTLPAVTSGSTGGLTYTYWTNPGATIAYGTPTTAGAGLYYIKGTSAGCSDTKPVTVTVNPKPTGVITGTTAICVGGSATLTITVTGSGTISGTLSDGSTFSGTAPTITKMVSPGATITYTITSLADANCTATSGTGSAIVTVNGSTPIATVTANPVAICLGSSSNLFIPATTSTLMSENFQGTNTFSIISTGPNVAASSWTSRTSAYTYNYNFGFSSITFNSGSTKFMLANSNDGGGATNTALVSPVVNASAYSTLTLSYRTYFRQNGGDLAAVEVSTNGTTWTTVQTLNGIGSSTNFSPQTISLTPYSGNASLQVRFRYSGNNDWWWAVDDVVLTGTSPTGNYSWTASPAATAGLPAGSSTPSVTNAAIVVTPTAAVTTTYTATLTNASGCTSTKNVVVTVNPTPVVTIAADYCVVPGKVRLTATSIPAATTYTWLPNQFGSGPIIDVDIADIYQVTASLGSCTSTANISVAQELVVNGDFSAGNTGFISGYDYDPTANGLVAPESEYAVNSNANFNHSNFWGYDHTSGTGTGNANFLIVNGAKVAIQPIVWQQTVSVLPNTTYYFSAWAKSLNASGPFAKLRFAVDGMQIGSQANLIAGQTNNANPWRPQDRFYGTWVSGLTATTAVISILDLETSAGGNDFGLDDISFGTLSTFVDLVSAVGTDAQTPCVNTPITDIVYSVGSSASGPTITPALPAGLTSSFNGVLFTISGTPTVAGNYAYTVTNSTNCPQPSSATGTINTLSQTIALTSGSATTNVCYNSPVSIGYTLGGTATGATVTGLPATVTGAVSGTTYTLSGTPVVAGTYPYTITTTGTCTPVTVNGILKVESPIITLNTANDNQTVCINTPITNIQYTIGGTATGATVTNLPAGLSSSFTSGTLFITGSPSASGTYTVTTTGGSCTQISVPGSITVTPAATLSLTSGAATNPQTVCINTAITDITYAVGNATGATVSGLPTSLTSAFNAGVLTISGTPTTAGVINYTVTTTGGCGTATAPGSITVQSQTITLNGISSPTLCVNTLMTNIVYTFGGTASSVTVTGLPAAGIIYNVSGNTITISGTPTVSGPIPYSITSSGNCSQVTASGTINVQPAAIGGTIASVSTCVGGSGNLNLIGQVGTITRWEYSTNLTGTGPWTPVTNNTVSLTYANITVPTLYRVVMTNGCGPVPSASALIGIHNLWTGATSIDWNTASNWSDGMLPSTSCADVTIPSVPSGGLRFPVIGSGTATITNLIIQSGASVIVNNANLQIAGTITNTGGSFNVTNGTLTLNGSVGQNIGGTTFVSNTIKNLTISNPGGVTISNSAGNLNIADVLSFGASNSTLHTSDNLVLLSTATGTARVADITNNGLYTNNKFDGNVTVERFYTARRAWRLATTPVSGGGSIFDTWQIGGGTNFIPNRGTYVSGRTATSPTGANGLDWTPLQNSSLKATVNLTEVLDTKIAKLSKLAADTSDNIPYFIFVRGDRQPINYNYPNVNTTTLSGAGKLQTGRQTFPANVAPAGFTLIGNPYAAPVNFNKLIRNGLSKRFWVWDPYLNVDQGGYVVVDDYDDDSIYVMTPPSPGHMNEIIQSGQAFFVETDSSNATTPYLMFEENFKSDTGINLKAFRPARGLKQSFRTNFYHLDASMNTQLLDGVYAQFDDRFNKAVDMQDAIKISNVKEMIALQRNNRTLSLERRPLITSEDTLYLRLTKTTQRGYRFEFEPNGFDPLLTATLEDSYTGAKTPLSTQTRSVFDFAINGNAASAAANRFTIVFKQIAAGPLPVTFKSVRAYQQAANIAVDWTVENELNVSKYEVEKSSDAINFVKVNTTAAVGANRTTTDYKWIDQNPVSGNNYYRIRSVDADGKYEYTKVVLVKIEAAGSGIRIYPNPVTNGIIGVEFKNMADGIYNTRLLNSVGQTMLLKQVNHAAGTSMENITPDYKLAAGIYQLEVTAPDKTVRNVKVIVK